MRIICSLFLSALLCAGATAQPASSPVIKAVDDWLKVQNKGLPGQVSSDIGPLDPQQPLAPCRQLEVTRPAGTRPWGRFNVVVRCLEEPGWKIYLPVVVRVQAPYLIAVRQVSAGQVLREEDIATQVGDLAELPANIATDAAHVIGKAAAGALLPGRPIRADMLRAPLIVRQGQSVKVLSRGPGFAVASEGKAMNNAAEGQLTQVRLAGGQVVSGIAKNGGIVEVSH